MYILFQHDWNQSQILIVPVHFIACCFTSSAPFQNLASLIKSYQAKVSEINEKSRQLSLQVAQSGTITPRKRYLPEMTYRTWTSIPGQEAPSTAISSLSHSMDSDSGRGSGLSLSLSAQSSPFSTATDHSITRQSWKSSSKPTMLPESAQFRPIVDETDSLNQRLSENMNFSRAKSASETHLPRPSFHSRPLGQSFLFGSSSDKQVTPQSHWSVSHDRPAKSPTPLGSGRVCSLPAIPRKGQRPHSHSPDKGRKSNKQSFSSSPLSTSRFSSNGPGASPLLLAVTGSEHTAVRGRLVGG